MAKRRRERQAIAVFTVQDVTRLLRSEVRKAGSQSAFSRAAGVSRVSLSYILRGKRPPTKKIIRALRAQDGFCSRLNAADRLTNGK